APAEPIHTSLFCTHSFGEIGMQLVLLTDALLLDAVPALLLGYSERTGDVISKVQTLLFRQVVVANGLVVILQLQMTLAQEEVRLDRLAVQLQRVLTVGQCFVVLLQLYVAQSPVGVVHSYGGVSVLGEDETHRRLLILAVEEEPVALLLQLLRGGTLLRAARHLLCQPCDTLSTFLPYPGWSLHSAGVAPSLGRRRHKERPRSLSDVCGLKGLRFSLSPLLLF
uniref:Uncharacterized protein n=1 Tax=Paramormyrops kingsleyae TaxID=1676925 RepID=A0A3B3S2B9_9TELE